MTVPFIKTGRGGAKKLRSRSKIRHLNILVAEDDENDFHFLKCMLQKIPHISLFRVASGDEAIDYLGGKKGFSKRAKFPFPDIFLVDLNLPKVPGLKILEWFQSRPAASQVRVCVLSASDAPEDQKRALAAGAEKYFVKPLSLGHLAELFYPGRAIHSPAD